MMINISKSSKGFTMWLAFNIIIISTVTCRFTRTDHDDGDEMDIEIIIHDDTQIFENALKEIIIDLTDEHTSNIETGLAYALSSMTDITEDKLDVTDYEQIVVLNFHKQSTNITPLMIYEPFDFTLHSQNVFGYFRKLFHITHADYFGSVRSLKSISNPGASKSIFYLTRDNKFIIKSVEGNEFAVLQQMLPKYKEHVKNNPQTLLPKFSGLYSYDDFSINIKLISMNNLMPSGINIHTKYDLKGSKINRRASETERAKPSPTFKDLDFDEYYKDGIFLKPDTRLNFLRTLVEDCIFLINSYVMDYSILMGIYEIENDDSSCKQNALDIWTQSVSGPLQIKNDETRNQDKNCNFLKGSIPAQSKSGQKLLLFVGIIDILQKYRLVKKIEYGVNIVLKQSASVQNPNKYAIRLFDYFQKFVFKPLLPSNGSEDTTINQIELDLRKKLLAVNGCSNCFPTNTSEND